MKILLVGGGSGGHVTPLKAVALQLQQINPAIKITVVTDRPFFHATVKIFAGDRSVRLKTIFAGKLRRYYGKSLLWHCTHLPTVLLNIRDSVYIMLGVLQSLWLLIWYRPDTVFCKGGFVCVPVGLVASLLRIPLVIHDSDTRPGLTNRLLSKWAQSIATGMPQQFYPYPKDKMHHVGMPVSEQFRPLSAIEQASWKVKLGFSATQPVVLVTGGGNGSESINTAMQQSAERLITAGWGIIHLAGEGKTDQVRAVRRLLPKTVQKQWQIEDFADMVPRLLAADAIVARTSASTLQEAANAKKLVIGIPSPFLVDQLKNATYFEKHNAIIRLDEGTGFAERLLQAILTSRLPKHGKYAQRLHSVFAKPAAAQELALMIYRSVKRIS